MERTLDPDEIVETSRRLVERIGERFPESGLESVAAEVHQVTREARDRAARIRRPHVPLRIACAFVIAAIVLVPVAILFELRLGAELFQATSFIQTVEALLGSIVFLGAAVVFLVTLETRLKRHRALRALHELRSLAHLVDMHQLPKVPERALRGTAPTASSPTRDLSAPEMLRYLNYCIDLLALLSKLGAIYTQDFPDTHACSAADRLAELTSELSRQIWEKMMAL